MKKIMALILALCMAAAVAGCASSPEKVKLASPWAMTWWCGRQYGAAKVVKRSKGNETIVYTMRDKEKGFTYKARSYVSTIWLDTVWGYKEAKSSDFSEVYKKLFLSDYQSDIEELEQTYTVTFDFDFILTFAAVRGSDLGDCQAAAEGFLDLAAGFDRRDYWGDVEVHIYLDGEDAGYVGESSGYVTHAEEKAAWLMQVAAWDIHTSVEDLTFVRMEENVSCQSLPGYDPDKRAHLLGTDNDTKTETDVCWFIYDGQEYFVADLIVETPTGSTRHLGNYPFWLDR